MVCMMVVAGYIVTQGGGWHSQLTTSFKMNLRVYLESSKAFLMFMSGSLFHKCCLDR